MYRSPAGKHVLQTCYRNARALLDVETTDQDVETRHGQTHVLLAGPHDGQPIVVLHGGNATNPMTLSWFTELADSYRLIAPDIVGQPGFSAEGRLNPRSDDYGEWVGDLLDAFAIESAPMIGVSFGAGILLRAAAYAPSRIERAALVVPAGFGTGSPRGMMAVGLWGMLYRYYPREWVLDRLLSLLVTQTRPAPVVRETIGASLRYLHLERTFPSANAAELSEFTAPVVVFLGEADPLFPSAQLLPRVRERFATIEAIETLAGEKHILSRSAQKHVTMAIRDAL